MSSPHMSFRLNHYHLAKALRILVTLEPNQPIPSLSQAAKMIIIDWIAKHSINAPLSTSQADIEAIKSIEKIPTEQINPYTTIQTIMEQAKTRYQQVQPQQPIQPREQIQKQAEKIQRELEEDRIFNEMRQESLTKLVKQKQQEEQDQSEKQKTLKDQQIAEQIVLASQAENRTRIKPSEFHDPNITESEISSVTDFSPPPEWKNKQ